MEVSRERWPKGKIAGDSWGLRHGKTNRTNRATRRFRYHFGHGRMEHFLKKRRRQIFGPVMESVNFISPLPIRSRGTETRYRDLVVS